MHIRIVGWTDGWMLDGQQRAHKICKNTSLACSSSSSSSVNAATCGCMRCALCVCVCACGCRLSVCITFINFDDSRTSVCSGASERVSARANILTVNHFWCTSQFTFSLMYRQQQCVCVCASVWCWCTHVCARHLSGMSQRRRRRGTGGVMDEFTSQKMHNPKTNKNESKNGRNEKKNGFHSEL